MKCDFVGIPFTPITRMTPDMRHVGSSKFDHHPSICYVLQNTILSHKSSPLKEWCVEFTDTIIRLFVLYRVHGVNCNVVIFV